MFAKNDKKIIKNKYLAFGKKLRNSIFVSHFKDSHLQYEPMGFWMHATDWVGKLEYIEKCSDALLFLDWLNII